MRRFTFAVGDGADRAGVSAPGIARSSAPIRQRAFGASPGERADGVPRGGSGRRRNRVGIVDARPGRVAARTGARLPKSAARPRPCGSRGSRCARRTFTAAVDAFVTRLAATAPFDRLVSAINVYRIDVASPRAVRTMPPSPLVVRERRPGRTSAPSSAETVCVACWGSTVRSPGLPAGRFRLGHHHGARRLGGGAAELDHGRRPAHDHRVRRRRRRMVERRVRVHGQIAWWPLVK